MKQFFTDILTCSIGIVEYDMLRCYNNGQDELPSNTCPLPRKCLSNLNLALRRWQLLDDPVKIHDTYEGVIVDMKIIEKNDLCELTINLSGYASGVVEKMMYSWLHKFKKTDVHQYINSLTQFLMGDSYKFIFGKT